MLGRKIWRQLRSCRCCSPPDKKLRKYYALVHTHAHTTNSRHLELVLGGGQQQRSKPRTYSLDLIALTAIALSRAHSTVTSSLAYDPRKRHAEHTKEADKGGFTNRWRNILAARNIEVEECKK